MSNNGFGVERDPLFNENNLIWMDLEMTGLEPQINRILEMAAVITDPQLNVIAEGPVVAIHQDAAILSNMDSWNTAQGALSCRHVLGEEVNKDLSGFVFRDFAFQTAIDKAASGMCSGIPRVHVGKQSHGRRSRSNLY